MQHIIITTHAQTPRTLVTVISRSAAALAFAWLLTAIGGVAAFAQEPQLPAPAGRITDLANLLDDALEGRLDQLLKETEDKTSAEVAVVTVPTLQGLTVEYYAERLFRQWGIGQEKIDNGVLVLVAPNEREMRIEVGYGLEGVLPDGLAGDLVTNTFLPHFRNDDYARGIDEGVKRVAEIVQRNHVLTAAELQALAESRQTSPLAVMAFFAIFVAPGAFMLGAGIGSKTGFPLVFGSLFGGVPFLLATVLAPTIALWTLGPAAAGLIVLGFRNGRKRPAWIKSMRAGSRGAGGSGWVMGGQSSGGSGSSGGRGSGGGFSGGRSGGGGASGRW